MSDADLPVPRAGGPQIRPADAVGIRSAAACSCMRHPGGRRTTATAASSSSGGLQLAGSLLGHCENAFSAAQRDACLSPHPGRGTTFASGRARFWWSRPAIASPRRRAHTPPSRVGTRRWPCGRRRRRSLSYIDGDASSSVVHRAPAATNSTATPGFLVDHHITVSTRSAGQ
jgi:hypothetical protein